VFLVNSRFSRFSAAPCTQTTCIKHPLSRSYGVILPSSFRLVLSSSQRCYACSPVSDYSTMPRSLTTSHNNGSNPSKHSFLEQFIHAHVRRHSNEPLTPLHATHHQAVSYVLSVMLQPFPINYALRLHLRDRLTLAHTLSTKNP